MNGAQDMIVDHNMVVPQVFRRLRKVGGTALSDFTFRSVAVEETTPLCRLKRYAKVKLRLGIMQLA
jgi:hypothetical protein